MTDRSDTAALPEPAVLARALFGLLDVEELDTNLFRGHRDEHPDGRARVFGGQVIAQALQAATKTADEGRPVHSLHAYFVRPGDPDRPVLYRVERDLDGRSFSNRRVVAIQQGKTILNLSCSFHTPEEGLSHADAMPDVPGPEDLPTDADIAAGLSLPEGFRAWMARPRPIELRRVTTTMLRAEKSEPLHHMWFRAAASPPDEHGLSAAVLAYASDMALLGTAMMPHGVNWMTKGMRAASVDHALWFHDEVRMGEWHLYTTTSPWAGRARGFNLGQVFRQDGTLVASVAQEGLIRYRPDA